MNEHEIERIAAAMNHLRPDWPVRSLRTLLASDKLKDRPRRDVTVALAWVACESNTATPARVLEAGPWWRAAAIEGGAGPRQPFDPATFCGTCGRARGGCVAHEFVSVVTAKRAAVDSGGRVDRLRAVHDEATSALCRHGVARERCADCQRADAVAAEPVAEPEEEAS